MKWKDLSLKERKQIYDSVRVNNPGATYFDIKEQFDSIPAYEDGGKSIVDEVNKSDANFVQRLKSPTRQTIPNWEDQYRVLPWEKSVSTHKLYDLYRNKNEYIDRLNKLIPMEILMPLGGAGFVGHELNKE